MRRLNRRQKPEPEHVLVRIKNELGLRQAEIPESLGIPLATFKNIVHGIVKSWDKHAATVSQATGIAVKSLLENNPRKPLLANDDERWTAQKYAPGIARLHVSNLVYERSRGRHTLQWFRIVMIKVCRCMLAAYRDKKSGDAFMKLLQAIGETGKSFPSFTAKVPYKPTPGEPVRVECFPPDNIAVPVKEICWSQDWDFQLQSAVAAIDSTSPQGMEIIFDRFKKDILEEEGKQGEKLQFDLRDAVQKAKLVAASKPKVKPTKPPRR